MSIRVYKWEKLKIGKRLVVRWQKAGFKSALSARQTLLRSANYYRVNQKVEFAIATSVEGPAVIATRIK
jgi:hypothetical protein